jgi:hypothetical protein
MLDRETATALAAQTTVSMSELAGYLGLGTTNGARLWCHRHGVELRKIDRRCYAKGADVLDVFGLTGGEDVNPDQLVLLRVVGDDGKTW